MLGVFFNPPNLYESQFGGIGIIFSKSWKRENHLDSRCIYTYWKQQGTESDEARIIYLPNTPIRPYAHTPS